MGNEILPDQDFRTRETATDFRPRKIRNFRKIIKTIAFEKPGKTQKWGEDGTLKVSILVSGKCSKGPKHAVGWF
jgi:hypothetical protein